MSRPPILMKDAFVQNCRAALAVMDSVLCEQLSNGAKLRSQSLQAPDISEVFSVFPFG